MKNYFEFTLTGNRLFPFWLLLYFLVFIPYGISLSMLSNNTTGDSSIVWSSFFPLLFILLSYLVVFYIIKMVVEGIRYKEENIRFEGSFATYVGKMLLGILLSIITLFIYTAWFIKDMINFFVDNSSLKEEKFNFMGKGGKLFWILFLSLVLPILLFSIFAAGFISTINENSLHNLIFQAVMMIVMVPYIYFCYKWMVDIHYKNYRIKWETDTVDSLFKIVTEILLCIVTLGIYTPMAYLRLFKYFSERTVAVSDETSMRFGFDYDASSDFLFIWGQILLSIITLGIYYPWALSNIGQRFAAQTYLEQA